MNTYSKYCPNVFLAKCTEKHEKGSIIPVSNKYGKENDSIVFNLIYERDGFYYYSIVRADGFNAQEHAKRKAERLLSAGANAEKKSTEYWEASHEGRDFLALGEPIKIGHHSEKRHRALIERNHSRMGKAVEFSKKAEEYQSRAKYWEDRKNIINLSMPESLEYFEFKLEEAKQQHKELKDNPEKRSHSMSLQYSNKAVKDIETNLKYAVKLWGDSDQINRIAIEEKEKAESKLSKKKVDIVKECNGFFAFNSEQFKEGYNKLKEDGIIEDDEKVIHVGIGLYIPKAKKELFLKLYK